MKVETVIAQFDSLIGQEIKIDGYITVEDQGRTHQIYVASSEEVAEKDQQQIALGQTLAELRTIIQPLATMQLVYHGTLTNPPYLYRFKAQVSAILEQASDGNPILKNITAIDVMIPYAGKMSEIMLHDTYHYSAQIDYTPLAVESQQKTARALITSQKTMILQDRNETASVIQHDENRYARRLQAHLIQVSGWLESVPSENDIIHYYLFMTYSLRASMVAVGPLRDATSVLLPPTEIYRLLKSHLKLEGENPTAHAIDIIGKIDYIADDRVPDIGIKSPKLIFDEIFGIITHERHYLW